jgi:transcriptional regulator with XRE-family HTH domain
MGTLIERKHRAELADFLRAKRGYLQPADVGIIGGFRRRVPGLRRQEVAELAGVSDTWYTWLEQGREMRVSPEMVDAVCRALRLNEEEHVYVRRLVDQPLIAPTKASEIEPHRSAALQGLLDDLLPSAAHISTSGWDLLLWNQAFEGIYGDPQRMPAERRNHLWSLFMVDEMRELHPDWELEARRAVSRFRSEEAWFHDQGPLNAIVAELLDRSADFRTAWESREVDRFVGNTRRIEHAKVGEIRFHLIRLTLEEPWLALYINRPIDEESRARMARLC